MAMRFYDNTGNNFQEFTDAGEVKVDPALVSAQTAHGSSEGAALTVTLDTGVSGGRTEVDVWVKSNNESTFKVQGSRDNTSWRQLRRNKFSDDSKTDLELSVNNSEEHLHFQNGYRYIRVTTPAAWNNEAEISASR